MYGDVHENVCSIVQKKCSGGVLFNRVCTYLNLVEQDFFGLTFVDNLLTVWFWLDFDKPILKQLKRAPCPALPCLLPHASCLAFSVASTLLRSGLQYRLRTVLTRT